MYALPPEASEAEFRDLLAYWQSKLEAGRLPGRQHIDPTELPPRHLAQLLLLEVVDVAAQPPRRRYRFRLAGTAYAAIAGREVTGLHCDEIGAPERSDLVIRALDLAVAHRAPVFLAGRLSMPPQDHLWVKRLVLPLARDGLRVDMVLKIWVAGRDVGTELSRSGFEGPGEGPILLQRG